MSDINIRQSGPTGRITLARPDALNALTHEMIHEIGHALAIWANDPSIAMLILDAEGDRAFCAGGDIADIYANLVAGDFDAARSFWRDEYPVNAALFKFPKPVATFLQGHTMGGGVGVGCHGSHRIVCETSSIAMPECSIGLVPDVGGSLLLARAPGRLGEYLGTTASRMNAADAIHAGFADYFVPYQNWPDLMSELEQTGDWTLIDQAAEVTAPSHLASQQDMIGSYFSGETLGDIVRALKHGNPEHAEFIDSTLSKIDRNAPLAMAAAVEIIHRARGRDRIEDALRNEYRFAHRVAQSGDFQEGIRAALIDKDKSPRWQHESPMSHLASDVAQMLLPLGKDEIELELRQ